MPRLICLGMLLPLEEVQERRSVISALLQQSQSSEGSQHPEGRVTPPRLSGEHARPQQRPHRHPQSCAQGMPHGAQTNSAETQNSPETNKSKPQNQQLLETNAKLSSLAVFQVIFFHASCHTDIYSHRVKHKQVKLLLPHAKAEKKLL